MNKPRIMKVDGIFHCYGSGYIGYGKDLETSYLEWLINIEINYIVDGVEELPDEYSDLCNKYVAFKTKKMRGYEDYSPTEESSDDNSPLRCIAWFMAAIILLCLLVRLFV